MKYFFILGSQPTLSLAELAAVFNGGRLSLAQKNIAVLETSQNLKPDILKAVGGTIKFGSLFREMAFSAARDILPVLPMPEKSAGKFNFGISFYGKTGLNQKALGMEFKKSLKQAGVSSRWVISREPTLSSVVVEQNKLTTDRGMEIVLIEYDKKLLLGKTIAVQPFKELSFRDYGRPARDDRSGMLPPKLAQMMINLSRAAGDGVILDPFCGSGTIITEAILMGYRNIIGSDISAKAIEDTRANLEWIKNNFQLSITNCQLKMADATKLSQIFKPSSINAIVTEPYLGPQRGKIDPDKIKDELEKLYSSALREFAKLLRPAGQVVMVWPVFAAKPGPFFLEPKIDGFKIVNPLPENLRRHAFLNLTARATMVYGREEQKVWREIVILEKES